MKEHTWTVSGTDAATCKDAGATHYSCSVCGATREESIPATGEHTWTLTDEKPSTCTEAGYRTYTCTGCDTTRTEEVARKPHAWTETGRKEATCIETGHVNYVCGQCGATRTEMLDLIEHPWTETGRLDPTCMEDGYVDYVCDYCAEERHDVLLATGHSYGEFTSNFGSTHSRVCSECGDVETQSCQWIVVEIGDIRCSSCTVCRFVKTEIIGLEVLDNLGENNMAIAKTVNTENVKMEIDLSTFVVPGTDPEDPEQKPVETHLTITESSEALPENCSVVKMFNISLEVNGEQQTNVGQKVVLSLPLSELSDMTEIEKDTGNYKLFVLGENGELIEVEYEIVDGMLILNTEIFGMFVMLTAEEAALLAK